MSRSQNICRRVTVGSIILYFLEFQHPLFIKSPLSLSLYPYPPPPPITLSDSQKNRCKEECPVHTGTDTYTKFMPVACPTFYLPEPMAQAWVTFPSVLLQIEKQIMYSLSSMRKSEQWISQTTHCHRRHCGLFPVFIQKATAKDPRTNNICAWSDLLLEILRMIAMLSAYRISFENSNL